MKRIGDLSTTVALEHARQLQLSGGTPLDGRIADWNDVPESTAREVYDISRRRADLDGAMLMSSGGTTGTPKLTFVPYHQACSRLLREWRPLAQGDVMLNLFTPGRFWASHYYMQELAAVSGAIVAPTGPFDIDDIRNWVQIFRDNGVNALAGTPTGIHEFAIGVEKSGMTLPVSKIIWMAEPWVGGKRNFTRRVFPNAKFWGNYGSVETYVVGTNTPECDSDVMHLLEDQLLEIDKDGALITRTGPGWTIPLVRYRLRDEIVLTKCRCGRPHAFRVLGRADDAIILRSTMFSINEMLSKAREQPGVEETQLICDPEEDNPKAASRVVLSFVGTADPENVKAALLDFFYDLPTITRPFPDAFKVKSATKLIANNRTNKVPPLIWRKET
jgi:phenylacetate-CoA ligase